MNQRWVVGILKASQPRTHAPVAGGITGDRIRVSDDGRFSGRIE